MVARDGVEPPTPAFSALFRPNCVFNQQLNSSGWPIYCDHSVTSADVRLTSAENIKNEHERSEREAISRPFVETVLPAKQSMIRLVYNLPVEELSLGRFLLA